MNSIDIIVSIFLVLLTLSGYRSGLVKQAFDLVVSFFAFLLAYSFTPTITLWLNDRFGLYSFLQRYFPQGLSAAGLGKMLVNICIFVIMYNLCKLLILAVGSLMNRLIDVPIISTLNRLGGAGFALLKGLAILLVVVSIVCLLPSDVVPDIYYQSQCVQEILIFSPYLLEKLQELMRNVLQYLPTQAL